MNPHYPYEHLANVGSRSYQRAWVRHAIAATDAARYDGIMMDNVLGLVSGWTGGVYPAAYPSDRAWEKAMSKFVRFVGPALKRRKLYVLANTFKGGSNDGSANVRWWKTVAPYVSGLMAEYWEQTPTLQPFDVNPCCWTGHWDTRLRLAAAAQGAGADFFPLQYGPSTDTRTMTYGKASFLLVWNGRGGGYMFTPTNPADPWNPAWTTPIGKPSGPRRHVGFGWLRSYTRGVALVNPDPNNAKRSRWAGSTSDLMDNWFRLSL